MPFEWPRPKDPELLRVGFVDDKDPPFLPNERFTLTAFRQSTGDILRGIVLS